MREMNFARRLKSISPTIAHCPIYARNEFRATVETHFAHHCPIYARNEFRATVETHFAYHCPLPDLCAK